MVSNVVTLPTKRTFLQQLHSRFEDSANTCHRLARECREAGDYRHAEAYTASGAAWSAAARDVRTFMMELKE
jgi:hypothetical protein